MILALLFSTLTYAANPWHQKVFFTGEEVRKHLCESSLEFENKVQYQLEIKTKCTPLPFEELSSGKYLFEAFHLCDGVPNQAILGIKKQDVIDWKLSCFALIKDVYFSDSALQACDQAKNPHQLMRCLQLVKGVRFQSEGLSYCKKSYRKSQRLLSRSKTRPFDLYLGCLGFVKNQALRKEALLRDCSYFQASQCFMAADLTPLKDPLEACESQLEKTVGDLEHLPQLFSSEPQKLQVTKEVLPLINQINAYLQSSNASVFSPKPEALPASSPSADPSSLELQSVEDPKGSDGMDSLSESKNIKEIKN